MSTLKPSCKDSGLPFVTLSSGYTMPSLGLGTWQMDERETETAVKKALDMGYRHVDTAFIYHNEVAVGKAVRQKIREGVIKREDVFVTSKLWNTFHSRDKVVEACRRSHRYLSLDYIDLYLVHWPFGLKSEKEPRNAQEFDGFDDTSLEDTWREMEKCVDEGLVRSLGVSNFNSVQLTRILNIARIKPAVNQVEVHIGLHQQSLLKFCHDRGLAVMGYCPLGAPNRPTPRKSQPCILEHPVLVEMAARRRMTPALIALRYVIDCGAIPIPKSSNEAHMRENLQVYDFSLDKNEMAALDKLNTEERIMTYPLARHHLDYPFKIPF